MIYGDVGECEGGFCGCFCWYFLDECVVVVVVDGELVSFLVVCCFVCEYFVYCECVDGEE